MAAACGNRIDRYAHGNVGVDQLPIQQIQSEETAAEKEVSTSVGRTMWVTVNGLRLKMKIYKSARLSKNPTLIVVLHGDLLEAGAAPSYHYAFAHRAAEQMDNLVVAALLRPGYTDDVGRSLRGQTWHGNRR